LFLTFGISTFLVGQDLPVVPKETLDSIPSPNVDSIPFDTDIIPENSLNIPSNTLETSKSVPQKISVAISPDSPDEPVEYNAQGGDCGRNSRSFRQ